MSRSVIVDAVRSPIGVKRGRMACNIRPDDLAARVLKALLERNTQFDVNHVEDVVLGCGYPEGSQGMLIARSSAVLAGVPVEAGAKVVNRLCGSSMDAVHQLSRAIEVGDIEAGIAAGVEDMFTVPRGGFYPDHHPQLEKKEYYIEMGMTAENLAEEMDISREDQEAFAVASHEKALSAQVDGRFENEIVPVELEDGTIIKKDEGPRTPDLEKIRSLPPAFLSLVASLPKNTASLCGLKSSPAPWLVWSGRGWGWAPFPLQKKRCNSPASPWMTWTSLN